MNPMNSSLMLLICSFLMIDSAYLSYAKPSGKISKEDTEEKLRDEAFWGRIYMANGIEPIQYFRDNYGGKIPKDEYSLYFPKENLGCKEFLDKEETNAIVSMPTFLVLNRGNCTFDVKSRNAERSGALGLIIISADDHVVRPIADVPKKEIAIPTVMIRQSGGKQLRETNDRHKIFARFIPIHCSKVKGESACEPLTKSEKIHSKTVHVEGGHVYFENEKKIIGEFRASSFGAPFNNESISVITTSPKHGCEPLENPEIVAGKAVLIERGSCNFLQKISHAQMAGAHMVLISSSDHTISQPTINVQWHGYNITIPSAMIAFDTAQKLLSKKQCKIRLLKKNEVATSLDEILRLSDVNSWPSKKKLRKELLRRMLARNSAVESRVKSIKHLFEKVAGGSTKQIEEVEKEIEQSKSARKHEEL